jgi:hypothetical protein
LGWKETVRISPLEDTIVAMRPAIPTLPFDFPNSVRRLSPMMPDGAAIDLSSVKEPAGVGMSAFAPNGEPIDVYNHYVNFGAEYVYHCHILSHEEMDMMHSVLFAFPPVAPSGLAFDTATGTLTWTDNSLSETAFVGEKSQDGGISWFELGRIDRVLTDPNITGGTESFIDPAWLVGDQYRVVAQNSVGDTWDYSDPNLNEIVPGTFAFPVVTTKAVSEVLTVTPPPPPAAPSDLTATLVAGPQVSLAWTDNSNNETGFLIQRSTDGVNFSDLATVGADTISYVDLAVSGGNTYYYQVAAFNVGGSSAYSNTASVTIPATPAAPSGLTATLQAGPQVSLAWVDNSTDETGFVIERSTDGVNFSVLAVVGADTIGYIDSAVSAGVTYTYRVAAFNAGGPSAYSNTASVTVPPLTCGGLTPTIVGTPGNDVLLGTGAADVIAGLGGNDTISGRGGNDVICGGEGNDTLEGNNGNDQVFGELGDDTLSGGNGNDWVDGGEGNDALSGGGGNDTCDGDGGAADTATATCEVILNVP